MSSDPYNYLDGNAAAGELSRIFAMDVTVAQGRCANCGAIKRFAEAHIYMRPRPRGAMPSLPTRTSSSCKSSPARFP